MKILAKMIVDPRLREDDENGREDDMQQKRGGGFPLCISSAFSH